MLLKIKAYRSNDVEDGESIVVSVNQKVIVFCAADIYRLIGMLSEARSHALQADVGDDALELSLTL